MGNSPVDGKNDTDLWNDIRKGDAKALSVLYQRYHLSIITFGLKIHPEASLVKDCAQDIFSEIWEKRAVLPTVQLVSPYLFRWMRNRLLKTLQKNHKTKPLSLQEDLWEAGSPESSIIEEQDSEMEKEKMAKLMELLTKRQKEVIYLRFYENCSYEEIGKITSLSYQAVRNTMYKALKILREHASELFLAVAISGKIFF